MSDPVIKNTSNKSQDESKKNIGTGGVFGGKEDVFDNEDFLKPLDTDRKKEEFEISHQNEKEESNNEIDFDLDNIELINHPEENNHHPDSFDPIFDDEDKKQEDIDISPKVKDDEIKIENSENKKENSENKKENENKEFDEEDIITEENKNKIASQEGEKYQKTNKDFLETDKQENLDEEQIDNDDVPIENNKNNIISQKEEEKEEEYQKTKENILETDEEESADVEQIDNGDIPTEEEKIELEPVKKSDIINKFDELVEKSSELYKVAEMQDGEYVELVGGDTGKSQITYNLWLIQEEDQNNSILISKIETANDDGEQEQNNLHLKNEQGSLQIILDEILLYDEVQDLIDDENKKMQVIDKLNKFIFLVSEELKIYEREKKDREIMEKERRRLKDIFRNF